MQRQSQSKKLSRHFKKLNFSHHCTVRNKSRVVYNSKFSCKQLFDKNVVNSLKKLHAKRRLLYSDVLSQSIVQKPHRCERRLSNAPKRSAKVLNVHSTESVFNVNRKENKRGVKKGTAKAKMPYKFKIETTNRFHILQNDVVNNCKTDNAHISASTGYTLKKRICFR